MQTKLPEFCPGRIISMSETVEVASRFPNTIVTLVKGPFWEWLLSMYVIVQAISPEFCCTYIDSCRPAWVATCVVSACVGIVK